MRIYAISVVLVVEEVIQAFEGETTNEIFSQKI